MRSFRLEIRADRDTHVLRFDGFHYALRSDHVGNLEWEDGGEGPRPFLGDKEVITSLWTRYC